jgi:lipid-A-disaccharide synthase
MPDLLGAVELLQRDGAIQPLLGVPRNFDHARVFAKFRERMSALSIKVIEDATWDLLAHSALAFAASGTVTVEAAVLGTPMVTFYKVAALSWWAGRRLVKVPYLSMVNLIAGRQVVPELIQTDMNPTSLAEAAGALLRDPQRAENMRAELLMLKGQLTGPTDPFVHAAEMIASDLGDAAV